MHPRVAVLIVSYNTRALLLEAVASAIDEPAVEIIVVDNASTDGSADAVAERFPSVKVIRSPSNLGFAAGTNCAACHATANYLLLLNPDAALTPGALDLLLELMDQQPRAAAIGPALVYADGRPQAAAFRFPGLRQIYLDLFPIPRLTDSAFNGRVHSTRPLPIDHPLGACMLIRRTAWQDVGPLDEGYFMYLEEVDWCRRARAHGWQCWYQPRATAIHHGGSSTRQQPTTMYAQLWRSRLRYYQRFHGPFYNRLVHVLVRFGMRARAVAAVRQLAS